MNSRGFTLIELLVVLFILGILMGIITPELEGLKELLPVDSLRDLIQPSDKVVVTKG